jgi:hypothetical protein
MKLSAIVVGLLMVAAGVVGIVAPGVLVTIGRDIATPTGLYVVGALRVVIGVVLVLAAPTSRMPRTLRVLGGIVVIGGIATPLFGVDRSRTVIEWWASVDPLFRRLEFAFAAAFGGFIIYATGPIRGRH